MIRVWKAIKWQIQAVFHEIRTAAAFFLVLNAVLLLLPLSAKSSITWQDSPSCS